MDYVEEKIKAYKKIGQEAEEKKFINWLVPKVGLTTMVYGIQLFLFPEILGRYSVYHYLDQFFNPSIAALIFVILSVSLIVSHFIKVKFIMRLSTALLIAMWFVFTVSFFFSPPPNTIWIFSTFMFAVTISIARRI